MRKPVPALTAVIVALACAGCGDMFSAPFDIKKPAPAADKTPADIVPQTIEGVKVTNRTTTPLAGGVTGVSETAVYDNGVTLTIMKLGDAGSAGTRLDEFYESELKGGSKMKVGTPGSGWAQRKGQDGYAFGWTNGPWCLLARGPSKEAVEKVILATGLAGPPAAR